MDNYCESLIYYVSRNTAFDLNERQNQRCLEALPVDDGRARLVVLLLGNPHCLEGGEGCQDGAANPNRVLPLRRSDDLDLHG